jgi:hypothetical protein
MIYVINYTLKIKFFHLYKKHNMTTQEALSSNRYHKTLV